MAIFNEKLSFMSEDNEKISKDQEREEKKEMAIEIRPQVLHVLKLSDVGFKVTIIHIFKKNSWQESTKRKRKSNWNFIHKNIAEIKNLIKWEIKLAEEITSELE